MKSLARRAPPQSNRVAPTETATGQRGSASLTTEDTLELQEMIGNRGVQDMLADKDAARDPEVLFDAAEQEPGSNVADDMAARAGMDLGDMEVHQGPAADVALAALGAKGATREDQILLPEDPEPELVAHEVAHVAQASQGGTGSALDKGLDKGEKDPAEVEAQDMAEDMVKGVPVQTPRAPAAGVHRFGLDDVSEFFGGAVDTVRGWMGFGNDEQLQSDQGTTVAPGREAVAAQEPLPSTSTESQDQNNEKDAKDKKKVTLKDGLHFYPGEHLLVAVRGGEVIATFEAMGGPDAEVQSPIMNAGPTDEGDFVFQAAAAYRTNTWAWSRLAWGTKLIDKGSDIWYELPSGQYGSLQKDTGLQRSEIIDQHLALYGVAAVPKTWVFNDFGPLAVRYFRDLNGNRKLDGNERLEGEMIHTTPQDEAATARGLTVTLAQSHGCVHVKPADRDTMIKMGILSSGNSFVVHGYSEKHRS
jgi:hypothetical protein